MNIQNFRSISGMLSVLAMVIMTACAVGPNGQLGVDQRAAVEALPLGSALLGGFTCNQLAKKSSKRDLWTVGCAFAGYNWGNNKREELLSAMQNTAVAAARTGQLRRINWQSSDRQTAAQVTATPSRYGTDNYGNQCREVRMQVRVSDGTYRDQHMQMCHENGRWIFT